LRPLKVRFVTVVVTRALAYNCLSWIGKPEMGCEAARAIFFHQNQKLQNHPLCPKMDKFYTAH
jgi:hypothetical protein